MEELEQIFKTNEMSYYQESICIDEQSETSLQANYMNYHQYRVPYLTVVECKNTTMNNDKCASPEEIKKFVRNTQIILTISETRVYRNIFE